MTPVIQSLKQFLAQYILRHVITHEHVKDNKLRLGLVTFDDHYSDVNRKQIAGSIYMETDSNNVQHYINKDVPYFNYGLTDNLEQFMYWLHTVPLGYGGDIPEAIACATTSAVELDPTASIWIVTDSVPHGYSPVINDAYPYGCPCGATLPINHNIKVLVVRHASVAQTWQARTDYPVLYVPKSLNTYIDRPATDFDPYTDDDNDLRSSKPITDPVPSVLDPIVLNQQQIDELLRKSMDSPDIKKYMKDMIERTSRIRSWTQHEVSHPFDTDRTFKLRG